MGSTNGTRLNDKLLGPKDLAPLHIGDRLHLGPNLINVVEDEQDTENVGIPTVVANQPLDHRTGQPLAPAPPPPQNTPPPPPPQNTPPPPPPQTPPSPKTIGDTLYLGASWVIAPSTVSGMIYRLIVVGVAALVVVLVMGGAS